MDLQPLLALSDSGTLEQVHLWVLSVIVVGIVFYLAAKEDQRRW